MEREQKVEKAFQKFVTKTEKAKKEGWIYPNEYRQVLEDARTTLRDEGQPSNLYPDSQLNFYVIQD